MTENYVRMTCIFICTNLKSIMGLFGANNTVVNFWMQCVTLAVYVVVALKVERELFLCVVLTY